ncbi:MAG: NAD-dependent epimerase/dehydratase family protein [Firmicutes bacterium]|nr:NAD-dependent epimerase/dehydratase family protein [Bacillota bacterium]
MNLGKVLVTGGAGFIGSQLLKRIVPYCEKIYVIDDLSTGQYSAIPKANNICFFKDCITNVDLLAGLLPHVDYVFHLACSNLLKSVSNLEHDFYVNLYGGFTLLRLVQKHCYKLKRFIYTSTVSVYSNAEILPTPEDYYKISLPYAASKFATEHYCAVYYHLSRLPVCVLRLSNVYGPGQTTENPYCGVVAKFFEAAMAKKPLVIYGDGRQTRDFTYIDDVIDAILLAVNDDKAIGQIYNVGTGIETSIADLATKIMQITSFTNGTVIHQPARPVDIVYRRAIDAQKIQKELSWKINFSLTEGLQATYQWLKRGKKE